ncbi:hypothetical protein CNR22_18460 [Sphingobacteriaceae bacterium]|nr:hypothetical protein CNR22_18460 [Sphingobacteriaceae bacterium]
MISFRDLKDVCKNIERLSRGELIKDSKKIPGEILSLILKSIRNSNEFRIENIRKYFRNGSMITSQFPDAITRCELIQIGSRYKVKMIFYGNRWICYKHTFTQEELNLIPPGLKNLMKLVADSGWGLNLKTDAITEQSF